MLKEVEGLEKLHDFYLVDERLGGADFITL